MCSYSYEYRYEYRYNTRTVATRTVLVQVRCRYSTGTVELYLYGVPVLRTASIHAGTDSLRLLQVRVRRTEYGVRVPVHGSTSVRVLSTGNISILYVRYVVVYSYGTSSAQSTRSIPIPVLSTGIYVPRVPVPVRTGTRTVYS